jgi:RNA 2',3'-cyclic 3'-phosphodiesterase
LHHPRVIWTGMEAPEYLYELQKFLETASRKLGYRGEERSYSPHLTLGRVNEKVDADDRSKLETALRNFKGLDPGPYLIDTLHLFRSTLMPGGALYTSLSAAKLGEITTRSGGDS